ncbi:Hypothetical_protein [Hexamita inflata]|uniref:Hypothetical_protein n=1 Tax=Hexamita inflata TaxID=28002 RepID=A0AA86RNX4_9EUKA|nr:Hypothetical protein HINF_LOCUS64613 [Hexamita inflata]
MSTPLNRNGFNCILPGRNFEAAQKINAEQLQYKDLFIQLKKHNEQQNHATLIITWIRLQHRFYTNITISQHTWNSREQSTLCMCVVFIPASGFNILNIF